MMGVEKICEVAQSGFGRGLVVVVLMRTNHLHQDSPLQDMGRVWLAGVRSY